jgi:hypothetical protein
MGQCRLPSEFMKTAGPNPLFATACLSVCLLAPLPRKLDRHIQSKPFHRISLKYLLTVRRIRLGLKRVLCFLQGFPNESIRAFLLATKRAKCPAHRILPDLVTLIIIREQHKPRRSSYDFPQFSVTSSPSTFPSTPAFPKLNTSVYYPQPV